MLPSSVGPVSSILKQIRGASHARGKRRGQRAAGNQRRLDQDNSQHNPLQGYSPSFPAPPFS